MSGAAQFAGRDGMARGEDDAGEAIDVSGAGEAIDVSGAGEAINVSGANEAIDVSGANEAIDQSLVAHVARFADRLREHGIPIVVSDQILALAALRLLDVGDRDEVRRGLRTALKIEPRHRHTFDSLFRRLWLGAYRGDGDGESSGPSTPDPSTPGSAGGGPAPPGFTILGRSADARADPETTTDRSSGGYSARARLRRKSFDECTPDDLAAMHRIFGELARRLATRSSRRLEAARRGANIDLRRSWRRSLASGGELVELARRRRVVEHPSLVLLCDTSGSMDAHSRFLLSFAFALKQVARRTEVFAFNTSLTRLTPWIAPANVVATLERLARGVGDWSGGTRIGASLMAFADDHLARTVRPDTTVIILSDGLDRGDQPLLAAAMVRIRRRARQVIWLNPLMGDPRYRPEARGMQTALPHVDHLVTAHNLESLEALLPLLAA